MRRTHTSTVSSSRLRPTAVQRPLESIACFFKSSSEDSAARSVSSIVHKIHDIMAKTSQNLLRGFLKCHSRKSSTLRFLQPSLCRQIFLVLRNGINKWVHSQGAAKTLPLQGEPFWILVKQKHGDSVWYISTRAWLNKNSSYTFLKFCKCSCCVFKTTSVVSLNTLHSAGHLLLLL